MVDSKLKPNRKSKFQSSSRFQVLSITVVVLLILSFGVTATASTDLDVPYIHQVADTPGDFDGRWACGATSAVMIAAYHDRLPVDKIDCYYCDPTGESHESKYGTYLNKEYWLYGYTFNHYGELTPYEYYNDPTPEEDYGSYGYIHSTCSNGGPGCADPNYAKGYFRRHGFESEVVNSPDQQVLKSEIDKGHPVWASTELFGGHIVVIKGYIK